MTRAAGKDRLVEFACRLEEVMRWLYAAASREVTGSASELLQRLAGAEEGHLSSLERAFGMRLKDKRWSAPVGAYVRAHVLKTSAPRIASDDVSEILRIGYALEVGTGRFYRRWLEHESDPQAQVVLPWLIGVEDLHRAWVSECHEELFGTPLEDEGLDDELMDWPEL